MALQCRFGARLSRASADVSLSKVSLKSVIPGGALARYLKE